MCIRFGRSAVRACNNIGKYILRSSYYLRCILSRAVTVLRACRLLGRHALRLGGIFYRRIRYRRSRLLRRGRCARAFIRSCFCHELAERCVRAIGAVDIFREFRDKLVVIVGDRILVTTDNVLFILGVAHYVADDSLRIKFRVGIVYRKIVKIRGRVSRLLKGFFLFAFATRFTLVPCDI